MHACYMREMSNIASEEKAVLEGIFARCYLTGLYRKGVLIIFLDHITNYAYIFFCFFKHRAT